ncbi:MAG TPA: ABC transporter ATP-binding protein [Candidatus Cloacimonadota bacterium]|nr:ABC transporter ATP-binding protein [Candidatus Cloacimonadota bacterium]
MLELRQISLRYPKQQDYLLKELSLKFCPGTFSVLKGSNGSGKSSLLSIISGIIPTHINADFSGQVLYDEADITWLPLSGRQNLLSFQMASPESQFFFPSLAHELSFPLENMGLAPREIKRRIAEVCGYFSLGDLLSIDAATCSPGQQKLMLWALCELTDAPVILLDEPCSGVSPARQDLLFSWIDKLLSRKKIVIAASHESRLIAMAEQVIELDRIRGVRS